MKRHAVVAILALVLLLAPAASHAEAPATIRIGVLNDMSGPYADLSGKGSVVAAQMAADDFVHEAGAGAPKVEILSADHRRAPGASASPHATAAGCRR